MGDGQYMFILFVNFQNFLLFDFQKPASARCFIYEHKTMHIIIHIYNYIVLYCMFLHSFQYKLTVNLEFNKIREKLICQTFYFKFRQ